ncbi:hypothetical protein NQ317_011134 [Molorchus minor]|uniref:Maturase K n=1 Tax=Molorchus minor TaxID=1323400 RepID=A0ABQ9IR54_9CUCU|nr:hypothetical protein NQ317_011134 [Molorchus minor]
MYLWIEFFLDRGCEPVDSSVRFPNLKLLDYILWGYLKDLVYAGQVNRIWRHNFKVTDWLIHSLIYTNVCRKHLVAGFVN